MTTPSTDTAPPVRRVSAPLRIRVEWTRQLRRRRTLWAFGLLLALPLILVAAFAIGGGGGPGGGAATTGARFVDLARDGSANFTLFALFVSAELLLVILAALFMGDPVPAEASWSSLRYLLVAPVPRARLLTSKLVVGMLTTLIAVALMPAWSLVVGGVAYGWAPFSNPAGGVMPWGDVLLRLVVAVAYLTVSVMQIGALAFFIGVRTDTPLAAVGGAVLASIISSIVGQIESLGGWRDVLPMHYSRAWLDLFGSEILWDQMRLGVLWSVLYSVIFVALAFRHFRRKDILS